MKKLLITLAVVAFFGLSSCEKTEDLTHKKYCYDCIRTTYVFDTIEYRDTVPYCGVTYYEMSDIIEAFEDVKIHNGYITMTCIKQYSHEQKK